MTVLTIRSFSVSSEITKIHLISRAVRQQNLSYYGINPRTLNCFKVKIQYIQLEMTIMVTYINHLVVEFICKHVFTEFAFELPRAATNFRKPAWAMRNIYHMDRTLFLGTPDAPATYLSDFLMKRFTLVINSP